MLSATRSDRPIRDYAAIGDCHGSALVASDGSIDWCTLHRFDAEPVFCRLLDADRGGSWQIAPLIDAVGDRRYAPGTNVLITHFVTESGEVRVTDFMAVGRRLDAGIHDYVHLNAPGWLVRRVEGVSGETRMGLHYRPSREFARTAPTLRHHQQSVGGDGLPSLYGTVPFDVGKELVTAEFTLRQGMRQDFVLAGNTVQGESPLARVAEFEHATRAFWTEWLSYCRYRGPYRSVVERSALILKAMGYAPSGAIVAALTTSLPEEIGGSRNWDYRYCWLRDSSFALYALAVLGYGGEARRFHEFLIDACRRTLPRVQIMYGVEREHELDEAELDHLAGYAGSRPVRTGNSAYLQRQIDVYGQILDLADLFRALGGQLDTQYVRLLTTFARFAEAHWREPDQGLWEMRGPARHHVHGKLMSWVAFDRASRLLPESKHWAALAQQARREIIANAVDPDRGHLRQAYDGGVDAAVLLAPMLGFPLDSQTLGRTVDEVQAVLGRGDYLLRYAGEDGLAGHEGAFLICSFWLADSLLALGRIDDARALFERLLGCANDVGLYGEEIDPANGAFLGNFPQAFTHLALIGTAANLELACGKSAHTFPGSYASRARASVGATYGWRGVLAALRQGRLPRRLRSSALSMLPWP